MQSRLRLRFLYSYVVLLLVAMLLMAGIAAHGFNLFKQDIFHKNALILDYVKKTFDTRLSEISLLSYEASGNDRLISVSKGGGAKTIEEAVRLTRYLRILKSVGGIVTDVSVYFPSTDQIINSTGRFSARLFYRLSNRDDAQTYRAFRETLKKTHVLEYAVEKLVGEAGKEERIITFYHTFRDRDGGEDPLLIIRLNNKDIESMIDSVATQSGECFALLADDLTPIAKAGNKQLLEQILPELKESLDKPMQTLAGGSLVVSQSPSRVKGIRYVSVSRESIFLGALNQARAIMTVGSVLIALLGVAIALYFAKKNEKPLTDITRVIEAASPGADRGGDVYAYIEENVRRIIDENKSIFHRMEMQRGALKRGFVGRLLRGREADANRFLTQCAQFGIDCAGAGHCAFIVYIHAVPTQVEQSVDELDDALFTILQSCVRSLSGEVDRDCDAEVAIVNDLYSGWLLLPDDERAEALADRYLERLHSLLRDRCGFDLGIARGSVYRSFEQVPLSYSEALMTLDELIARGGRSLLSYPSLAPEAVKSAENPMELFGKFVNCLKLTDYQNASQLTELVFGDYLNGSLPPETYVLRKSALISVLSDAVAQARERFGDCASFTVSLSTAQQPGALEESVRGALKELSAAQAGAAGSGGRLEEIRAYIDKNITNPDLSLSHLSEKFDINGGYLSKLLKNEFGAGMLDYINRSRVALAKEKLLQTDKSVQAIAQELGYTSDITFIRVFKRYEGTTPGRYRDARGGN